MKKVPFLFVLITIFMSINACNGLLPKTTVIPSIMLTPTITHTRTERNTNTSTPTITPTITITSTPTTTETPYNIKILAIIPWTNTHIQVKSGNNLRITAYGTAYTDNRVGGIGWGPDGNGGSCPADCLMPGAPYVSLVGKIDKGDPFLIGKSRSITITEDGVLFLAVNDNSIYYFDNHGYFIVDIYIR
jgi:hypothetical protein